MWENGGATASETSTRSPVHRLRSPLPMRGAEVDWDKERRELLGRRISELGLRIQESPLQRLVEELYRELDTKGLAFRPPVYLSDEWGCPDGTPLIAVPFYLADRRLLKLEEEFALEVEREEDSLRFLRHEAGHAINYAYRLYDRPEWRRIFGPYSRPYRERFHVNPFSRAHVRHILGWYGQKHPDEDFAETFAVWLTPGLDWRREYAGWPALAKLDYVDRLMHELRGQESPPPAPRPTPADLPVEVMHFTIEEHYESVEESIPIEDDRLFDGDLRNLFREGAAEGDRSAAEFLRRHRRELVGRIAYWTGETTMVIRAFIDFLAARAETLGLQMRADDTVTLVDVVAFATAVVMNYRYTDTLHGSEEEAAA